MLEKIPEKYLKDPVQRDDYIWGFLKGYIETHKLLKEVQNYPELLPLLEEMSNGKNSANAKAVAKGAAKGAAAGQTKTTADDVLVIPAKWCKNPRDKHAYIMGFMRAYHREYQRRTGQRGQGILGQNNRRNNRQGGQHVHVHIHKGILGI